VRDFICIGLSIGGVRGKKDIRCIFYLRQRICSRVAEVIVNAPFNESMLSFYLDHLPAGTTVKTFLHYAQLYDTYPGKKWVASEDKEGIFSSG